MKLPALALLAAAACCAATTPSGFPFADETLNYSIVWPSGLSLGEAHLQASHFDSGWNFDLRVNASLPGYAILDHYRAAASNELCSSLFERETVHGARKTSERTSVSGALATRATAGGGGKAEFPVAACAHDALTFLFFVRQELGQGRIAPPQSVLFGPPYPIQLEYLGRRSVPVNEVATDSDLVVATLRLPKGSDYRIEMYFARDAARTPLVMRAPFAIGTFSVELQR